MIHQEIFDLISRERYRQDALKAMGKFPFTCADTPGLTTGQKLGVLMEEVGEVARAALRADRIVTDGSEHLKTELVQVAAVCLAWLESL